MITNESGEQAAAIRACRLSSWCGKDFVAFGVTNKGESIARELAREPPGDAVLRIGIGDSGGDLPFLCHKEILGIYVGETLDCGSVEHSRIVGVAATRQVLLCLDRLVASRATVGDAIAVVNKLVRREMSVPDGLDPDSPLRVRLYLDKDGTIVPGKLQQTTSEMAALLARLLHHSHVTVISSNRPEELTRNLLHPIESHWGDAEYDARARFTILGDNGISRIYWNGVARQYETKEDPARIDAETRTIIFKAITWGFTSALRELGGKSTLGYQSLGDLVRTIESTLPECTGPKTVIEAFNKILLPYRDRLGSPFLKQWDDKMCTLELDGNSCLSKDRFTRATLESAVATLQQLVAG